MFSVIILLLFGLLGRYLVVLKRETKIIQILVRKNQLNLDTFDSVEKNLNYNEHGNFRSNPFNLFIADLAFETLCKEVCELAVYYQTGYIFSAHFSYVQALQLNLDYGFVVKLPFLGICSKKSLSRHFASAVYQKS